MSPGQSFEQQMRKLIEQERALERIDPARLAKLLDDANTDECPHSTSCKPAIAIDEHEK